MVNTVSNPVFRVEEGKIKVFMKGFKIQIFDPRAEPTTQEDFQARSDEHRELVEYCDTNGVEYAEKDIAE